MDTCQPDSTVEIIELDDEPMSQELTPLQLMKQQFIERTDQGREAVEAARRDRDRVHSQLQEARKQREIVLADLRQMVETSRNTAQNLSNVKISLEEAIRKRCDLMKEIDAERMWRPPSTEMSLKKQRDLRERVEHMRTILHKGKICTPED